MARLDNPGDNRPTATPPASTNPDPLASNPNDTQGVGQQAKEQVRNLAEDAKRETSKVAGQASDYVSGLVSRQKDQAADSLGGVAGAIRDVGNRLQEQDQAAGVGQYAMRAADQVDRLSSYLRDRDLNTFFRDTETFARRHPDVFLGGTFLAGLLLARFLKSSSDRGFGGYDANAYVSFDEGYGRRYGRSGYDGDDTNAYASYPGERYGRGNDYQGPQEPFRTREKEGPYGEPEGFKVPDTPGGA